MDFSSILKATLSIVGISGVLALIISIAEKILNDYGVCELNINNGDKVLQVEGGSTLLSTLAQEKIFIPSACGGKATCGLCKVRVLSGAGPLLPTEEPYLDEKEREDNVRLSCQIKVKGNMQLAIPEELFNIKEYIGTVEKITDLTHDIKLVRFKLSDDNPIKFKAGQFVQLYTKPYAKVSEEVFRAYSIASAPSDTNHVDLIIRQVPEGIATGYVHLALEEGDKVQLSGPYGDFYLRGGEGVKELIMIAGGSGMAPIRSLLLDIFEKGLDYKIRYYFTVSKAKDQYYVEELTALAKEHPNFTYVPIVSRSEEGDGWTGEKRKIVQIIKEDLGGGEGKEAYMCGSPGMLDACTEALIEAGLPEECIFYDKF